MARLKRLFRLWAARKIEEAYIRHVVIPTGPRDLEGYKLEVVAYWIPPYRFYVDGDRRRH